jgi:SAM-dependent methyltransferase
MSQPEFDHYSESYSDLLRDPIRDYFTGDQSQFFHLRKRDLICAFFRRRGVDTKQLRYLDLGCGQGDLLRILAPNFQYAAGCDPSSGMIARLAGVDARLQADESEIPFPESSFDFVTASAVFHHVPPAKRAALVQEVNRVLKPAGVFAIIEHNPLNPVTRLIVSRTPVDAGAILLPSGEAARLMTSAGLLPNKPYYFLYLPMRLYNHGGRHLEALLTRLPLGGQYAVFGTKTVTPGRRQETA